MRLELVLLDRCFEKISKENELKHIVDVQKPMLFIKTGNLAGLQHFLDHERIIFQY